MNSVAVGIPDGLVSLLLPTLEALGYMFFELALIYRQWASIRVEDHALPTLVPGSMWRGGRRDEKPSVSGLRHKIRHSRLEICLHALTQHLAEAE